MTAGLARTRSDQSDTSIAKWILPEVDQNNDSDTLTLPPFDESRSQAHDGPRRSRWSDAPGERRILTCPDRNRKEAQPGLG